MVYRSGTMNTGDQVLMTLMRLRLCLLYGDLARRFHIPVAQVGRVFRKLMNILAGIFSKVIAWLPKEEILATLPAQFIEGGYANTTAIIDCTEAPLQMPKRLFARGQSFSYYKGRNTVKFLITVAPSGVVKLVSCAYGGRASDKHIVDESGFVEYLSHNDHIMADKGFSLSTEMKEEGVKLNVPAFTRGRKQISEMEATVSRRISRLRIHVERAIGRIKTYRILKQPLAIHPKKIMNKIVQVCAGLCNLKGPLIANREPQKRKIRDNND
ncbi:uncharacterized protein LOC8025694 [Ixodes scapularis]|uniref:uncharacterized protein LOC8025694 n=1 Tax=Ixodes scapularis TaxID=6945 RepID=UPI001A9E5A5E|nr:uncharacterized protein LOC8025694 [Ixodes scapularis]